MIKSKSGFCLTMICLVLSCCIISLNSEAASKSAEYRSSDSTKQYVKVNSKKTELKIQGKVTKKAGKGSLRLIPLVKQQGNYYELNTKNQTFRIRNGKFTISLSNKKILKFQKNGYCEVQLYIPKSKSFLFYLTIKKNKVTVYRDKRRAVNVLASRFVKKTGKSGGLFSIETNPFVNSPSSMKLTEQEQAEIATFTTALCKNSKSDVDKAETIYTWITKNIYYNKRETNPIKNGNNNPYYVFKNRYAVCEGYARLYREMLISQNIPAVHMTGYGAGGQIIGADLESHAWVMVYADSRWFFADPTWDSNNTYDKKTKKFKKDTATNLYFDQSFDAFSMTHRIRAIETGKLLNEVPVSFIDGEIAATTYQGTKTQVTYPSSYRGLPITTINGTAFKDSFKASVEKVIVPSGYKKLCSYAFQYYYKLKALYLPDSVKQMQQGILFNSQSLTTVYAKKNSYAYQKSKSMKYKTLEWRK